MKSTLVTASMACLFAAAAVSCAKADVTVVQSTVINCPGVRQLLAELPEAQRSLFGKTLSPMIMGAPWVTTTYMQGSRMRTDMGETTVIINTSSGHAVTLNKQTHAYSIGPYDPFQKQTGQMTCRITPTGQTSTILGHTVQGYAIAMTASILPKALITGEIWAAPDLPTPPPSGYAGGSAAGFEAQMAVIKGMPLAYRIEYKNTPAGDISIQSNAVSTSDTALSAAVFEIPSDFHKGQVQTAFSTPSTGFPLGDGMPLDTIGGMTSDVASGSGGLGDVGGISPEALQQMLGSLGGSSGGASQSISPEELKRALAAVQAGGAGGAGAGSSADIGQLSSMLDSLMSGDE